MPTRLNNSGFVRGNSMTSRLADAASQPISRRQTQHHSIRVETTCSSGKAAAREKDPRSFIHALAQMERSSAPSIEKLHEQPRANAEPPPKRRYPSRAAAETRRIRGPIRVAELTRRHSFFPRAERFAMWLFEMCSKGVADRICWSMRANSKVLIPHEL